MRPVLRTTPRLRRGRQEHHAHDEAVSDMIGRTLAHYQIPAPLGEGGMGVVYKARDTHLDRFVAIKVLRPDKIADAERKRRFGQEAKAASALNHPNIVHVYDIAEAEGIVRDSPAFALRATVGTLRLTCERRVERATGIEPF
jgi:serine/threonine protein kinase